MCKIQIEGDKKVLAINRLKKIEDLLTQNGSVTINNLSLLLKVSEETIRRDLDKLSKTIKFKRVRGGAYLFQTSDIEVPVKIREEMYVKEKKIIGEQSVSFIEEGDTIMLDSSTTALYIAKILNKKNKKATVITNSSQIINELSENKLIEVICLGGKLRRSTKSFVGSAATGNLKNLFGDKSFVSCTSINLEFGITDNNNLEAEIRRMMFKNSVKKFLVVDHTKFDKPAINKICDLKDIDVLIIDKKISEKYMKILNKNKVEVIFCE